MRLFLKISAAVFIFAAFQLSAVDFYDLQSQDFWRPAGESAIFDFEKITVSGKTVLRSREPIKIDPDKTYHIKMKISGNADDSTVFYGGFDPCNRKGASFPANSIQCYNKSFTVLSRKAAKGSTVIYIKDGKHWQASPYACVVFNAKKDFSDIPNTNLGARGIISLKKLDNEYQVQLKNPLQKDLPAGMNLRLHSDGGYCYLLGANITIKPEQIIVIDKKIKGAAPFGFYNSKKWPSNIKYAYMVLLLDWRNTFTPVTITEASMTVE